ncbi:SWIM zinc finger family protein [Enterovibrio norvegicus]|uniref:SWIM zinc finger family protein n=1 Tax=Enterovibrio norvegicus TaxID=188144 RepID=UPI0024B1DCCA|nr:SWIM zinc finger family protein [Enterovibrio norvegicus]
MINQGQLREWAGVATFDKGERLAKQGQVFNYHYQDGSITAQVQGEYLYDVSMVSEHDVNCTCPAAQYQPICKHGVATCLVHLGHYSSPQLCPPEDALSLPDEEHITHWLATLDKDALIDIIRAQYTDNPTVYEVLQYRCYVETQQGSLSAKQVTALIDEALPLECAWEYDESNEYFATLEEKYSALRDALCSLTDNECFPVAWHGIVRLNTVCIEYVDSSHGDYYTTYALFLQQFMDALEGSDTALTDKLSFIIDALTTPLDINDDFLEELDSKAPTVSNALRELIHSETGVKALPKDATKTLCLHYSRKAAKKEQWQDAITWRLNTDPSWFDWLGIGQYHLKLEQYPQATQCLERATQQCQHHDHALLIDFRCEIANAQGQNDKVWQIRWQQFEKHPNGMTCGILQQAMSSDTQQKAAQQSEIIDFLLQRVNEPSANPRQTHSDIQLLVERALEYHCLDVLVEWGNHPAIAPHLGIRVADAITDAHYKLACKLYHQAIEATVEETNNHAYLEAVKMIVQFKTLNSREPEKHSHDWQNFVTQLKQKMKKKRNFVRYLEERFPQDKTH